jgi:hypothetical protein
MVGQLLGGYAAALDNKQPLKTFADSGQQRWVYMIPAVHQNGEEFNMLVLAIDVTRPGTLTLELMFIDPEQFRRDAAAE